MQFVIKGWKILFACLIFIHMLELSISTRIEMNAGDKKICLGCLNIIKILRNVKSSSVCDRISQTSFKDAVGVDLNGLPQNELMCYEIYYYFYFFKPSYLSKLDVNLNTPESYIEMLVHTVHNVEQSDCNVCAYLDKCEYYGCAKQLASKDRVPEGDKKKEIEVIQVDINKTRLLEPKNEIDLLRSQEKNTKKIDLGVMKNSNFNSLVVEENKTSNFVKENYSEGVEPMNKFDINFLSKSMISSKAGKGRSNINSRQNIESLNILYEHFDLAKVKIEHMLDEVYNLANIHRSIQEIKKKALNNLISRKLQTRLPTDVELIPLRIVNQDNLRNYLYDIKIISEKFETILYATKSQIMDNLNKYFSEFDMNNLNYVHSKNIDTSLQYLISFTNCYNELYLLGNSIYQSNINTVESIRRLFPHSEITEFPNIPHKIDVGVNRRPVSLQISQLKNININVDEKVFLEKNNLIKNETKQILPIDLENSIHSLMQNITKFKTVNITKYHDNDSLNEYSKEKMKSSNETRSLSTNSQNIIDNIKNSNIKIIHKNNTVNVTLDSKNITVKLIPDTQNKFNETNYLVERLQKLEQEQERFNLFLKNSSLLDAYNGRAQQLISKKGKDEEEIDQDDDDTFEDEKENEESFEDRRDLSSYYHVKPTRGYASLPNNKENYSNIKRIRTEIVKSNHIYHSRPKYDHKETSDENEINTIDLNKNEMRKNPIERKPYARKFLRKINIR